MPARCGVFSRLARQVHGVTSSMFAGAATRHTGAAWACDPERRRSFRADFQPTHVTQIAAVAASKGGFRKRITAAVVPVIFLRLTRAGLGIEAEQMEIFDPRPSVERFAQLWREIDLGCEQMRQNGKAKAADELLKRANEVKAVFRAVLFSSLQGRPP